MRPDWIVRPLGAVLNLKYGKPLAPNDRDVDGKYPAYGANGVKCRTNRYLSDAPTIVIGRKGSAGEVTLTESAFWPLDVTYYASFDRDRYDLRFLYHRLSSLGLKSLARGVKPGLNREDVYRIQVAFPCLSEQKQIAAILDGAFAGIDATIANAEKNLANSRELFDSSLDIAFRNRTPAWESIRLSELLERGWITSHLDGNHGSFYPRKDEFVTEGVAYISARCLEDEGVNLDLAKFLPPARADQIRKGVAQDGDVLFAHNATVGPVAVLRTDRERVILSTSLTYYRCEQSRIIPDYLAHFMRSPAFVLQYRAIMQQSTRNQVPISKQRGFFHLVPPLEDQRRLATVLDDLKKESERLATAYRAKVGALAELKQSILQKAFAGELTAKVAEREKAAV